MKIEYVLTASDFINNAGLEMRRVPLPFPWLGALIWGLFIAALLLVSGSALLEVFVVAASGLTLFYVTAKLQRHLWLRRCYSPDRLRGLGGEQQVEVTEDYLRETAPNRDVRWSWQDYSTVHETAAYVLIAPTPVNTVIVPIRAFSSDAERKEFIALIRSCIEKKSR